MGGYTEHKIKAALGNDDRSASIIRQVALKSAVEYACAAKHDVNTILANAETFNAWMTGASAAPASHTEGDNTQAKGNYSHAEGQEVNLIETTIVGSVAAIVGGAVAWFTKGRVESDSLQVRQAQAVLAMWQATSESQNKELTQLRNEVVSLRQRLEEMEHTIHELQAENAKLKCLLFYVHYVHITLTLHILLLHPIVLF